MQELALAQKFFSIMLDITANLMENTNTKHLMEVIMQRTAELIHCDRCSIFLVSAYLLQFRINIFLRLLHMSTQASEKL